MLQQRKKQMSKKVPPKNKTWVQLTEDFVKEWPEVLEGLHFSNLPVTYLLYVNLRLKNNITLSYNIQKELKKKSSLFIAKTLTKMLKDNYSNIKSAELRFDIPALKRDMESKTKNILAKSFR